ncbi:MAG: dTDP-4-dehydrorhamnose 3,5-epimerase family protein [Candidatus Diapherotrites archaeon]|nr:dTDP-4-dehydrorhamnose 3,5-epimerase family protein [Candidatus Diapherotrites archaeon]
MSAKDYGLRAALRAANFNGKKLISGVKLKKLRRIVDERGWLTEIMRSDWPLFKKFGQVYLSVCNPGYVKAWHYHKKQTDSFVIIYGRARVGLYDARKNSETFGITNEFIVDSNNPVLIQIPPGVWHGYEALGNEPAFLINVPDKLYNYENPDEFRERFNTNKVNFRWQGKKGG